MTANGELLRRIDLLRADLRASLGDDDEAAALRASADRRVQEPVLATMPASTTAESTVDQARRNGLLRIAGTGTFVSPRAAKQLRTRAGIEVVASAPVPAAGLADVAS